MRVNTPSLFRFRNTRTLLAFAISALASGGCVAFALSDRWRAGQEVAIPFRPSRTGMATTSIVSDVGAVPRTVSIPKVNPAILLSVLGTAAVIAIAAGLPARTGVLFNTPDETVNHLFTRTFAETGKLWYTNDYVSIDRENLLHPRGVLSHDGRAVSYQYPALPIVYGGLYRVVGENVKFIGVLLAVATLFFLYKTANLLLGARYWQVLAVFLGMTPLLFHFARPYLAAGPAITCFCGGVWLLARYFCWSRRRDLVFASGMFIAGMLFRYEFAIFSSLLVAAVLWHKHGRLIAGGLWLDLAIYGTAVSWLFVLPVLMMNTIIYGDALTYGYSLFNDAYLPDRGALEGASVLENAARMAMEVSFPQGSFDPQLLARNLARFSFGLMPILATLALLGAVLLFRRRPLAPRFLIPYAAVVGYVLVYMAGGDTWNATTKFATFDASFVRYWLPIDVLLALLALYGLRHFQDHAVQASIAVVLAAYGAASVLTLTNGSLVDVESSIDHYETWAQETIVPNTEEDAIIYTGRVDKAIVPYRNVAAWWGDTYDRMSVARSMSRVFYAGYPVYVYKERDLSIVDLNEALQNYDLHAISTDGPALYRVVKFDHSHE